MKAQTDGFVYNITSMDQLDKAKIIENSITTKKFTKLSCEVYRKNEKLRISRDYFDRNNLQDKLVRTNLITWDGIKTRGYTDDWNKRPNAPSGGLIEGERGKFFGHYLSAVECDTLELKGRLESHIDPSKWIIVGSENIGPYTTIHISGPVECRPNAHLHAWIDLTHDFAPVQLKLTYSDDENTQELIDSKLEKIDGVWVRTGCKTLIHNPVVNPGWQV
ncbi:MAG: hypothetical protein ABFS32_23320, partial [Bacteroidota bacterium]